MRGCFCPNCRAETWNPLQGGFCTQCGYGMDDELRAKYGFAPLKQTKPAHIKEEGKC